MKNCCFTGHRILSDHHTSLHIELENELRNLIDMGTVNFFAGGAIGWDMICSYTVCILRKKYPHITLNLILPCTPEQQCKNWEEWQKRRYYMLLRYANSVEYMSKDYYNGCMKARNQRLVDNSDICVCYYDERRSNSGTGQTVRMAQKKNITILNLYK